MLSTGSQQDIKIRDISNSNELRIKAEWPNTLRALATIGVIMVHVSTTSRTSGLNADLIYGALGRFCVPVFIMLSGALLLPKTYELADFLKNKFMRILLPFLFWSCIYLARDIYKLLKTQNTLSSDNNILEYIFNTLKDSSKIAPHLWYIYMIIGLYLLIPLIGPAVRNSKNNVLQFYLILWVIMSFFEFKELNYFRINFDMRYFTGYLGYLILGYYLSNRQKNSSLPYSLLLLAIGYLATVLGTYYKSQAFGEFNHSFYEYLTPNVIIMSTGAFLFIKNLDTSFLNPILQKALNLISNISYGIYLSHFIIILFLNKAFGINSELFTPILSIPLISILILAISVVVVLAIKKVKFGNYVAG